MDNKDKYKINPAWESAPYEVHTAQIEEVVVEAKFTVIFCNQMGRNKIRNILETQHKFLTGIPIDEQYDSTGTYVTFRQKQRRIKQHHVPSGGDYTMPHPEGKHDPFQEVHRYLNMLQRNKEQEREKQAKENAKKQQQSTPTPPPEIYPLNIFSVEDLNDSK